MDYDVGTNLQLQENDLSVFLLDMFAEFVLVLISRSPPVMRIEKKTTVIPNIEGRTVSFIIFALKLLFGLDGVAEEKLSRIVEKVNAQGNHKKSLFNFSKWLEYIEYRKAVIKEEHYPAQYTTKQYKNTPLFLDFLNEQKAKYDEKLQENFTINLIKNNLQKLKNMQPTRYSRHSTFKHSLTPYLDYTNHIVNNDQKGKYQEVLLSSFKDCSLEYMIKPAVFKSVICDNLEKKTLCNTKLRFVPITSLKNKHDVEHRQMRDQMVTVDLTDAVVEPKMPANDDKPVKEPDTQHESYLRSISKRHLKNVKRMSKEDDHLLEDIYQPCEKFWLQLTEVHLMYFDEFESYFKSLPLSFRLLVEECARITGQPVKYLYEEYSWTELHLCYNVQFNFKATKPVCDRKLKRLMATASKRW